MDAKSDETNARFAVATAEQRRNLLDVASGTRFAGGWASHLIMGLCVALLLGVQFMPGETGIGVIAFAAAFGIVHAYIALTVQMQQRFRALIRLLEIEQKLPQ
jgi:hypothetical protein